MLGSTVTLKKWREASGLTQRAIADRLGVHVQYVSAIERGARRPGMRVAKAIRDLTVGAVSIDAMVDDARDTA